MELRAHDGSIYQFELEPLLTFRMRGLGYTHPEWGHDTLYQYAQCLGTALLLLLIYGNVAHNLFRYHWLWYGAFLIVVRHRVQQRLHESADVAPATDDAAGGEADDADPDWDDPPPARELAGLAPGGSHG